MLMKIYEQKSQISIIPIILRMWIKSIDQAQGRDGGGSAFVKKSSSNIDIFILFIQLVTGQQRNSDILVVTS